MFPRLSFEEVERILPFGTRVQWRAGESIFSMGQPGPGLVVILKGIARVLRRDAAGNAHNLFEHRERNFLGEISHLYGNPCLGDAFAVQDTTGLVLTPDRLRSLLVADAELSEKIMRAFILRRVVMIEHGSGPVLIGDREDPRLISLRSFLQRNAYPHTVIDDRRAPDTLALLKRISASTDDLPIVVCPDGTILRSPEEKQIAALLGWLPDFDTDHVYDVVIVGAGPAGLAASVYAASEGLSVAVFDSRGPGGQASASARIENYLGFPNGVSGQALTACAFVQAQKFGVHISIPTRVVDLHCGSTPVEVELDSGKKVRTHAVVISSGAAYRKPVINGLEQLLGRGVFFGTSQIEARLCAGREIVVIGGGNSAGQGVVYLASHAKHVHLLVRGSGLGSSMSRYLIDRIANLPNVTLYTETNVVSVAGDVNGLTVVNCEGVAGTRSFSVRYLFLFTGAEPNTSWLKGCNVMTDENGFVLTGAKVHRGSDDGDRTLETNVPGVFAIGDVRSGSTKRVAAAVGEGAAVVAQIHQLQSRRPMSVGGNLLTLEQ